jgi:predicted MFS family arabinose efflux permease
MTHCAAPVPGRVGNGAPAPGIILSGVLCKNRSMHSTPKPAQHRGILALLGVACGVGVGNIYYNQPLLLEISHSLHIPGSRAGMIAVSTQVGYAVGLLTLVPLGDVVERRLLIIRLFALVSLASLLCAVAPQLWLLLVASSLLGLTAAVTHIVLPIAPEVASEAERGRAIGTVMTGLLLGVLLARSVAGGIATLLGWRAVFFFACAINAAFVPILWRSFPRLPPTHPLPYGRALRSLATIFRREALIREAAIEGGLFFAAFSTFWTTLAFLLGTPHYHLGPGTAGSFGILGATGALIAPIAGRMNDQRGSRFVITVALAVMIFSFVVLWVFGYHMVGLVVGVLVLDLGVQANQISNQTRIFGHLPQARSRVNTIYMTTYFLGGSIGSALSTWAWERWQWNGVCALGIGFLLLAALRHTTGVRLVSDKTRPAAPRIVEEA